MTDPAIVFLDSGIGGVPYLQWVRSRRPDLPMLYLADTKHFPYGDLPRKEVTRAVTETVSRLLDNVHPGLIALVCNTASVAALDEVREMADCPVVGTVPAVRQAALHNSRAPIGILATHGTVSSSYLDSLIEEHCGAQKVIRAAAGQIVRFVEEKWPDHGTVRSVIDPALNQLKSAGIGSLVLGCTHFIHVKNDIETVLGPDIPVFDSCGGVGRRILSLTAYAGLSASRPLFRVTGPPSARYRRLADLFDFEWGGIL